jgi:hypothetical protein
VTNIVVYNGTDLITAVKSFILQVPERHYGLITAGRISLVLGPVGDPPPLSEANVLKLFTAVIYERAK